MRDTTAHIAKLFCQAQIADEAGDHEVADAIDTHARATAVNKPHPYAERAMRHPAFHDWHNGSHVVDPNGHPAVVYHGTARADRFNNARFMKSRATSGPMQYFTENPEIASSYSKTKPDTSAYYDPNEDNDYELWFKMREKDHRKKSIPLSQSWYRLTPEQKQKVAELLPQIGYKDETGPIGVHGTSLGSPDHWEYEVEQHRGNWLAAAKEIWLNSAGMFGNEEDFMDVLKHAGLTNFEMRPRAGETPAAVIPVFLAIKKPLDTSNIPDEVIETLDRVAKRLRSKPKLGADAWDKRSRSAESWMNVLHQDLEEGTALAWTTVPDWVTNVLESFGYDGIKDVGGKMGGEQHVVWVPFHEWQVKSAIGNKGTFDPRKKQINR